VQFLAGYFGDKSTMAGLEVVVARLEAVADRLEALLPPEALPSKPGGPLIEIPSAPAFASCLGVLYFPSFPLIKNFKIKNGNFGYYCYKRLFCKYTINILKSVL